jgi:hypothetical protein
VWDTWPLVLKPVGMLLAAGAGVVIGIGIGGCGIVCNVAGSGFDLVEAAWLTAQQGIAALLIRDPAAEAAAAAAAAKAETAQAAAPAARADMPSDAQHCEMGDRHAADTSAKEELELADV